MALEIYRDKRNFRRTPEPRGVAGKSRGTSFVIHKHAARRLHYDFRLEHDGVLVSWAVPKGPSLDPGERRLAVKVEDHPLDYGAFEGNIPEGEYGAGAVIIWDQGRWLPEGDPAAGLRKGHLRFRLEGKKLAGEWSLVRMGKAAAKAGKENWLLIKGRDRNARTKDILADKPKSAVSGKTIEEVRAGEPAKLRNLKSDIQDLNMAPRASRSKLRKTKTTIRKSSSVLISQPNQGADAEEDKIAGVRLTHPERVLYPEQGITKRDLALYYAEIADWILPHLKDRPLTLVRCPESYDQECFYQRHANDMLDESVLRLRIKEKGRGRDYIAVDSLKGVIALVQAGVLELHTWGARRDRLDRPDRLTFDLDPDPSLPWRAVAEAARQLRARLADFGLGAFLKTTGGKGLHVVVPIARTIGWDETKAFAKAIAQGMAAEEPKKYLAVMSKAKRQGKIFIDYLRNGWAATAVAAFSTRARAGAPVSAPLFWHELDSCRGDTFNLKNIGARLARLKSDPWADYEAARRPLTAALRKKIAA